jgi:anti-anti-sigma factor
MLIVEREVGDVAVLEPRDRIDAAGREEFYRALYGTLERGSKKVLMDMTHVSYIDSAGVGVLFGAYTSLRKKEGKIRLASVGDRLRRILTLVCLEDMIEICDSVDDALDKFSREG